MLQNRNIVLSASHNSFDVDFEAINIDYRNDIAYQYILEGYDHDWSEMTMDGTARFRNVPPGNYTLKIKALRKSDGRVIDETSIDITVKRTVVEYNMGQNMLSGYNSLYYIFYN